MRYVGGILLVLMTYLSEADAAQSPLERLMAGNKRYQEEKLLHPNRSHESRVLVASGQTPYAIIIGCADSRVTPEIVFDQGIGDLFVVRVAGNVVGPIELDSIEFSAIYLKSSLIMVLGHESCGAVDAVLQGNTKDIEAVATLLDPAVQASKSMKGDPLENAVKTNIHMVAEQLSKSPVLAERVQQGTLKIVGGYYNLRSGEVEIIK